MPPDNVIYIYIYIYCIRERKCVCVCVCLVYETIYDVCAPTPKMESECVLVCLCVCERDSVSERDIEGEPPVDNVCVYCCVYVLVHVCLYWCMYVCTGANMYALVPKLGGRACTCLST